MMGDDEDLGVPRKTTVSEAMVSKLREGENYEDPRSLQLQTIDFWVGQLLILRARIEAGKKI